MIPRTITDAATELQLPNPDDIQSLNIQYGPDGTVHINIQRTPPTPPPGMTAPGPRHETFRLNP